MSRDVQEEVERKIGQSLPRSGLTKVRNIGHINAPPDPTQSRLTLVARVVEVPVGVDDRRENRLWPLRYFVTRFRLKSDAAREI